MPLSWGSDEELFAAARRELYSAVIGDVLDLLGYRHQFLPPEVRPLREDMVIAGRAMPVLEAAHDGREAREHGEPPPDGPFGLMLRALDDLQAGEVYVCAGGPRPYASWGELMSTCAANRGAAGAVIDGWSRDTRGILAQGFPCFSRGAFAQDQRSRGLVVDFRLPVTIGGVSIRPGDAVFGDLDGVVVVPREAEADVFRSAWEKAHGEKRVFEAIKGGMTAQQAWEKYGIF